MWKSYNVDRILFNKVNEMETKNVEIYIGWLDNTWGTHCVKIPIDSTDEERDRLIEDYITENFRAQHIIVSFWGIYYDPLGE